MNEFLSALHSATVPNGFQVSANSCSRLCVCVSLSLFPRGIFGKGWAMSWGQVVPPTPSPLPAAIAVDLSVWLCAFIFQLVQAAQGCQEHKPLKAE